MRSAREQSARCQAVHLGSGRCLWFALLGPDGPLVPRDVEPAFCATSERQPLKSINTNIWGSWREVFDVWNFHFTSNGYITWGI